MDSDSTQEYTLRVGVHTWIDGKTYDAKDPKNNKMTLTREQMERIGKHRFEAPADSGDADLAALREENRRLREQLTAIGFEESEDAPEDTNPIAVANSYADFLNRSVPDVSADLQKVTDMAELNAIQAEESKGGQPRVGVLKAINQRREELSR